MLIGFRLELNGFIQGLTLQYAHIEIGVAFLDVIIFKFVNMVSYGVRVITWEVGEVFSYVSSTFLYLLHAKIQAIYRP